MALRGGARPGAGRKPFSKEVRATAASIIFARREAGGKEPLAIMLEAMDDAYKGQGGAIAAFPFAQACAPFVHPKMASVEVGGTDGGPIAFERIERIIIGEKEDFAD